MTKNVPRKLPVFVAVCLALSQLVSPASRAQIGGEEAGLRINELEYLEMPGLNVMLAHDYYPESHQGGVGIIQNGLRVATNGDLRLEPTPGQWEPVPKVGKRVVDRQRREIGVRMQYPDPEKNRRGFNPIVYPGLELAYTLKIKPEGKSFRIVVDLDRPLPDAWVGRVGFNLELFPGVLFGKTFYMDGRPGVFPRQVNGPGARDDAGGYQVAPLAEGRRLVVAPDDERQTMVVENVGGGLQLLDGRAQHTNGWFVVRSPVAKGATANAVEWLVTPRAVPGWKHQPVVQVSQVGYHPAQEKVAVVETDPSDARRPVAALLRAAEGEGFEKVLEEAPAEWGRFLRYRYFRFDFTKVRRPGVYVVRYGDYQTEPFQISPDVYRRHVWQPTLEYFLPAQMCHVRVNDRYRVWHGACHLDDARMAPTNLNHIDGYAQGPTTLTKYASGDSVPGLDRGGWHDAGDDDMRVESQAETLQGLALLYEAFKVDYDNTSVDQPSRVVEVHRPDGRPDVLQQIEHGALSVVGGYKALGRLYRGIITPTLRQYTLLGDTANVTDNVPFDPKRMSGKEEPRLRREADGASVTDTRPHDPSGVPFGRPGEPDDRWVFTEENPGRELQAAAGLAAASRALKDFNPQLAADCLRVATELWDGTKEREALQRVEPAVELLLATGGRRYADFLKGATAEIVKNFPRVGWVAGRAVARVNDRRFTNSLTEAARAFRAQVDERGKKTPYGVPYEPDIWGAGWGIQRFGVEQYFLHASFPEVFNTDYMLRALNFILGCHPGPNTSSFASGVGARSLTTAYGFNRADWSYIPGGVGSGTALIRPDYPELLTWPFLWQQTEYVLGGGTTDYLILVLAAERLAGAQVPATPK